MQYFLAFDVGTTTMKCVLFDEKLGEVFQYSEEYELSTADGGVVTLNPVTYYNVFKASISAMGEKGIDLSQIKSLTFTTQGETLISIDRDGNALSDAIVWLDSRAEKEASAIKNGIGEDAFYQKTGLDSIDGTLPAAKLMWIFNNQRDLYDKTYKFLLLEDYLIYLLTGKTVSEMSLQSSTGWFDIVKGQYDDALLDFCNLDKDKLPEVLPCGTVVGNLHEKAMAETGLSSNTLVVTGAMDQVSSAVGAGNVKEGVVTETTGTALVVAATANAPDFTSDTKVTIYKHFNGSFFYVPFCRTAGIVLKWFKDTMMSELSLIEKETGKSAYGMIDDYAESAKPGCDGVICLANFSGSDRYENAVGTFLGITLNTGKAELCRSVLEGVACMLREKLELLRAAGVNVAEIRSLGGGSYSDIWCQIKASLCGVPVVRGNYAQSTALGAAILGAVAVGAFSSVEDALAIIKTTENTVMPNAADAEVYSGLFNRYISLHETLFKA